MIRLIITTSVVVGILTALTALIPTTFTATIDSAILFLFGWIKYTDVLFDPQTVLSCLRIISNMAAFTGLWVATKKIYHAIAE